MEKETKKKSLFWFRRDLRITDNTALYYALKDSDIVAPVFIFDKDILSQLPLQDKRVEFIWAAVNSLKLSLNNLGSDIIIRHASAEEEIVALAKKFNVSYVYANEDYEPDAIKRDDIVKTNLKEIGVELKLFKDQVIFAKNDILNNQSQPFVSFSSYKNNWMKKLTTNLIEMKKVSDFHDKLAKFKTEELIPLEKMGFKPTNLSKMRLDVSENGAVDLFNRFKMKAIQHYKVVREIPSFAGVSYLSVYNRFGLISIRKLISEIISLEKASPNNQSEGCQLWISELIWREFYMQLLYHFPHIKDMPFKTQYKDFEWENNFSYYQAWTEGKTGYPLIDASMNQLNETGYMHNRLRMVVASFLTKDLLIDYKLGEEYFSIKLLDFDLSANNGGWQWAASTGCDHSQYVRIFNPSRQSEKFDKDAKFIKKHLPIFKDVPSKFLHEPWLYKEELKKYGIVLGENYPERIVNHDERKVIAIKKYEDVNNK